MTGKLKVSVTPSPAAEAVIQILATDKEYGWPEAWSLIPWVALAMLDDIKRETKYQAHTAKELEASGWIEVRFHDKFKEPSPSVAELLRITADLGVLASDPDAEGAARGLFELLSWAKSCRSFHYDVFLGRSRATLDEALQELRTIGARCGYRFETERSHDVDLRDEPNDEHPDVELGDDSGKANEPEPEPAPGRKKRSRPRKASSGGFGGLKDESPSGPSEAEQFFLKYCQLSWPCSAERIRAAFKKATARIHPDKHPEDPHANGRFLLFKQGYEGLMRRVGEESHATRDGAKLP